MYVCMCVYGYRHTCTCKHVCVKTRVSLSEAIHLIFWDRVYTRPIGLSRASREAQGPSSFHPFPPALELQACTTMPSFLLGGCGSNSGLHACMPQALATVLSPQPPQFPPQFLEFMCQCSGAYILTTMTRGFRTLYNQRWNGDRMPGEEVFVAVHITLRHSVSLQLWPHRPKEHSDLCVPSHSTLPSKAAEHLSSAARLLQELGGGG